MQIKIDPPEEELTDMWWCCTTIAVRCNFFVSLQDDVIHWVLVIRYALISSVVDSNVRARLGTSCSPTALPASVSLVFLLHYKLYSYDARSFRCSHSTRNEILIHHNRIRILRHITGSMIPTSISILSFRWFIGQLSSITVLQMLPSIVRMWEAISGLLFSACMQCAHTTKVNLGERRNVDGRKCIDRVRAPPSSPINWLRLSFGSIMRWLMRS